MCEIIKEEWRDIKGHDGYLVSDRGQVRSADRYVADSHSNSGERLLKGKLIKTKSSAKCRTQVCLPNEDGKRVLYFVDEFVASAFIENSNDYEFVTHLDGDITNDKLSNLAWGTRQLGIVDKDEEWRPVVGLEDRYEVSDKGRIKRLPLTIMRDNGRPQHYCERILDTTVDSAGYRHVCLVDGDKKLKTTVAQIVAEAFIPRNDGAQRIRFINGDPSDCSVSNIKWGSPTISTPLESREKVDLPGEVWVDINGYEGLYQISNMGRVYSVPRPSTKVGIVRQISGSNGYLKVSLCKNGEVREHAVHRLVAEHFVENPKPDEYDVVNHKDENKHNNVWSNLEFCTTAYNLSYGTAIERRAASRKRHATDPDYVNTRKKTGEPKKKTKAVIQTDVDGNVINRWESIGDVVDALGHSRSCISRACNRSGRYTDGYAHGYYWRFEEE